MHFNNDYLVITAIKRRKAKTGSEYQHKMLHIVHDRINQF